MHDVSLSSTRVGGFSQSYTAANTINCKPSRTSALYKNQALYQEHVHCHGRVARKAYSVAMNPAIKMAIYVGPQYICSQLQVILLPGKLSASARLEHSTFPGWLKLHSDL